MSRAGLSEMISTVPGPVTWWAAGRSDRKAEDVALPEHALALGCPDTRRSRDDEQPLLHPVMEVVGVAPLTVTELVQAGADLLGPDHGPDARASPAVPVPLGRAIELRGEEVELAHRDILARLRRYGSSTRESRRVASAVSRADAISSTSIAPPARDRRHVRAARAGQALGDHRASVGADREPVRLGRERRDRALPEHDVDEADQDRPARDERQQQEQRGVGDAAEDERRIGPEHGARGGRAAEPDRDAGRERRARTAPSRP